MFRPTVLLNAATKAAAFRAAPISARVMPTAAARFYSAGAGLSESDIQTRVLNILKGFDKVDQSKVAVDAHFVNDLGLDSLDTVEVVMAIEEEFSVEIPDKEADEIKSAKQAVDYISKRPDAH
ncbi:acyl carrier protein-like protein [Radiomyces spectabilis]|uniref:acyl carrier protein-like protein n=1 Tax=Radiomyces spectabilis TaxID=64574 RepID=UPI00221F247A|nr:acyl carrier protein-like protein [Radiomyces spectabilis]KAI8393258.1 acyl carrier protein-like protein [Radiomyces spectabilis]